jgi:hypothetical protein
LNPTADIDPGGRSGNRSLGSLGADFVGFLLGKDPFSHKCIKQRLIISGLRARIEPNK